MKRLRLLVMTFLAMAGMMVAMTGRASAQPDPEVVLGDAQTILANLPAAGEELAAGLQEALDVLAGSQDASDTSAAVGAAFVAAGGSLVDGTAQFGALGLGLVLINGGFQSAVNPVTEGLIDNQDPSAVLDPEALEAIIANLPGFAEDVQNGTGDCFPAGGFADGVVQLLQGNIIDPPLGIGPAFWCYSVLQPVLAGFYATQGTPLEGTFQFLGVTVLVAGAALEPQVSDSVEPGIAPLIDALAPVTGPIIDALNGV